MFVAGPFTERRPIYFCAGHIIIALSLAHPTIVISVLAVRKFRLAYMSSTNDTIPKSVLDHYQHGLSVLEGENTSFKLISSFSFSSTIGREAFFGHPSHGGTNTSTYLRSHHPLLEESNSQCRFRQLLHVMDFFLHNLLSPVSRLQCNVASIYSHLHRRVYRGRSTDDLLSLNPSADTCLIQTGLINGVQAL